MIEKECQGSTENSSVNHRRTLNSPTFEGCFDCVRWLWVVVYGAIQQVCDLGVDAAPRHMVIQGRACRKPRLSEPSAGPTGFHRLVILAALTVGPE